MKKIKLRTLEGSPLDLVMPQNTDAEHDKRRFLNQKGLQAEPAKEPIFFENFLKKKEGAFKESELFMGSSIAWMKRKSKKRPHLFVREGSWPF